MSSCPLRIKLNTLSRALCVSNSEQTKWIEHFVRVGMIQTAYDIALIVLEEHEHEV